MRWPPWSPRIWGWRSIDTISCDDQLGRGVVGATPRPTTRAGLPQMTTHPDCARSVRADRTSRMALAPARGNRYAARTSSLLILPHPSSTLAPSGGTGGASPCPPSRLWYPRTARGVVCARRRQDKGVCTNGPESAPALAATGTPTPPRTPEGHVHGSGVSPGSMRVPHDPHPQVPPQGCLQMLTCYATRP